MKKKTVAWIAALFAFFICASDALAQGAVERTPHLGVGFSQGGRTAALTAAERTESYQVYTLTLRPSPFDITIPNTTWEAGEQRYYLALALSADPNFLSHLHIGQRSYDTDFLGVFRAMAFDPDNLGSLLTAEQPIHNRPDYGFNSLGDHRFDTSARGVQHLSVTTIDSRETLQPILADGLTVTMVFYVDRDQPSSAPLVGPLEDNDIVRGEEVDIVRVRFAAQ